MKKLICVAIMFVMFIGTVPVYAQDDLVNVFFTENRDYSVILPDGWVAEGDGEGGLWVANSDAALGVLGVDGDFTTGMIGINVFAIDVTLLPEAGLTEAATPSEVLDVIMTTALDENQFGVRFNAPLEFNYGGIDLAAVDGQDSRQDMTLVTFEIAPGFMAFAALSFERNEGFNLGVETFDVLVTVRYSQPLEATWEQVNTVSLFYPDGWETNVDENNLVYVGIDAASLTVQTLDDTHFAFIAASFGVNSSTITSTSNAATTIAGFFTTNPSEIGEPRTFLVNEQPVSMIDVVVPGAEGVAVVTQDPNGDYVFVVYLTGPGNTYQLELVAVNVVMSINNLEAAIKPPVTKGERGQGTGLGPKPE